MTYKRISIFLVATFCSVLAFQGQALGVLSTSEVGRVKVERDIEKMDREELLNQRTGQLWEIRISAEGYGQKVPDEFESDNLWASRVYTTLGAIAGGIYSFAKSNQPDPTRLLFIPVYAFVGGLIGLEIDSVSNAREYTSFNVGWINSDITDYKGAQLNAKEIIQAKSDNNIFEMPESEKVIGSIRKDDFRRVIESKKINKDVWFKIRITDEAIFKYKELVVQEGWLKADKTYSQSAKIGDIIYAETSTDIKEKPEPGQKIVSWIKKNRECLVIDLKDNSGHGWPDNEFNGLWYKIKFTRKPSNIF